MNVPNNATAKPTVMILHGIEGHAGKHWQQSLHDRLAENAYSVLMPDLPDADKPDRSTWLETIKKLTEDKDLSRLIMVAHSLGVVTALDFIEQARTSVYGLISVAGFGHDYGAELNSYFMKERELDFHKIRLHLRNSAVIYGDDDPYVPQEILAKLAEELNTDEYVIEAGGHINTASGFSEFPLLFELINNDFKLEEELEID